MSVERRAMREEVRNNKEKEERSKNYRTLGICKYL
jgi:hypothetical protein